jgi:hypothetical protein
MKKLTLAFAVAMAIMSFGCKKKDGGMNSGAAMAKMTEFKDKMCACKDMACATKVTEEMTAWGQEQSKTQKEPPKMSEADTKKFAEVTDAMGKCMQTAMSAGAAPAEGAAAPTEGGAAAPAEGSAAAPAEGGSAAAPAEPAK